MTMIEYETRVKRVGQSGSWSLGKVVGACRIVERRGVFERQQGADFVGGTAPCHFQIIAQGGACRKRPRLPHDALLRRRRNRRATCV
jgi:hypothetical protein